MYLLSFFINLMHPCQTKHTFLKKNKNLVIPKHLNGNVMSQMPESSLEICCCCCCFTYDLRIALLCVIFLYSRFNKDVYITLFSPMQSYFGA